MSIYVIINYAKITYMRMEAVKRVGAVSNVYWMPFFIRRITMRKAQKEQAESFITLLEQAHEEIKINIEKNNFEPVLVTLADCQDCAIALGNLVETCEGEGFVTISYLEKYCETVYQIYQSIDNGKLVDANKADKMLRKALIVAGNSVRNDIKIRKEVVFFPYKASMWDSLESVYLAAKEDPDCDAYCVPIPYFDKNPDGTAKEIHYEGMEYPADIEVIDWRSYNLEERRPDAIFIHNPYDEWNHVTSVHPDYYSSALKKYTDLLIYVPYYATAGGMSEGQALCPAYIHADYIVVQAEKYKEFFDPMIPKKKFLVMGSPKFDKVIRLCNNPPEAPTAWKEKMAGKKVYFYNTSINGMLADTRRFLMKMEYVFKCFEGRKDACIIWRPHPLLESTFTSMRAGYKPIYDELKKKFLESDFGIYDNTPDITNTIALCDAYIGDAGTSVTSLFGIVGKPLFILNNNINTLPEEDDWRGEIIKGFYVHGNDEWMITQGNKLYRSVNKDYDYRHFCDLSDYAYGNYYSSVVSVNGKDYVCPASAQDILVIGENGIERKINLEYCIEQRGAFCGAIGCGRYLFLIPYNYPAIVRYDTITDKIDYFGEHLDVFIGNKDGAKRIGGFCVWNGYLFLASPVDNHVLAIHAETGKMQVMTTGAENSCGCVYIAADKNDLWLLPYEGKVITVWNPESGEVHEYGEFPENCKCKHPILGFECEERPFASVAISDGNVYLPQYWANMSLRLDKKTGKMTKWETGCGTVEKSGYYTAAGTAYFTKPVETIDGEVHYLFSIQDRKLYLVNIKTNESKEIDVKFALDELKKNEPGFAEVSQWLQYACMENYFNSLPDFLDGNITGGSFDRDRQLRAYGEIAVNYDGTSGEKIHEFVRGKWSGQ